MLGRPVRRLLYLGDMGVMVLGAFETAERAGEALSRLEREQFKPGGFSVVAPESMRTEQAAPRQPEDGETLRGLLANMSDAPDLHVEGMEVAASGALVKYLSGSAKAGTRGLKGALEGLGSQSEEASHFEQAIEGHGLVLGIAAENDQRAMDASSILSDSGAIETIQLKIPASP